MFGRLGRGLIGVGLTAIIATASTTVAAAGEPRSPDERGLTGAPNEVLVDVVYARAWAANGRLIVAGELRNTSPYRLSG